jgi:hypothetical protein
MEKKRILPLGAIALTALVVSTIGPAMPGARADDGDPVLAGKFTSEANPTTLHRTTAGEAILGVASDGTGVRGLGKLGVRGVGVGGGSTGVEGVGGGGPTGLSTGVRGVGDLFGVNGSSSRGCNRLFCGAGVSGTNSGNGWGVFGASAGGVGVRAYSKNGTALAVSGKATFTRSGVVVVSPGSKAKSVAMPGVSTRSMILATAQQNTTVWVKAVVPGSGDFSIVLSGKAPASGLRVAYFVLN